MVDVSSVPPNRAGVGESGGSGVPDALSGPVYSSVSPLRAAEIMAFGAVSTAELSRALCCNARTGRRVLERLVEEGWARRTRDRPRRYSLSLRAAAMGAQALSRSPFASMAASLVGDLAAQAGRTVFVAVPCYERLLCVAGSEGAPFRRGDLLDIAGSAAGLLLLAQRPGWRRQLPPAVDERRSPHWCATGWPTPPVSWCSRPAPPSGPTSFKCELRSGAPTWMTRRPKGSTWISKTSAGRSCSTR